MEDEDAVVARRDGERGVAEARERRDALRAGRGRDGAVALGAVDDALDEAVELGARRLEQLREHAAVAAGRVGRGERDRARAKEQPRAARHERVARAPQRSCRPVHAAGIAAAAARAAGRRLVREECCRRHASRLQQLCRRHRRPPQRHRQPRQRR